MSTIMKAWKKPKCLFIKEWIVLCSCNNMLCSIQSEETIAQAKISTLRM